MYKISLSRQSVEDMLYFANGRAKTLGKIAKIINAIQKNPFQGIGKPEMLKHNLKGCWSRRVDKEHSSLSDS